MADRAVLQTEIEASGMVSGRNLAVHSLDDIKRAAAGGADGLKRYDLALRGVGSALQNSNAAGSASIRTLGEQIRQAQGLARAYTQGEAAVSRYNVELRVEEALAKANLTATGAQGRALANLVRQREAATAAVEREKAALAQRTAAAEAEAVANSQQVGMLSRLQSAYLASAVAAGVIVGAIRSVATAALEAEENERRLASAVERRGETFRMSTADLVAMASQFERTTAFEDDAIQKAQAILLRFDEIDATNIRDVLAATLDFAEATGQDAASAATAFGKALLVPGEAMRALKEVGITLTQQQEDMVDQWNTTGQSAKSVALLVGMMKDKIGGLSVEAAKTADGGIKQLNAAIGNLKETLGSWASSRELLVFLQMLATGVRGVDDAIKRDGIDAKIGKFLLLPGLTSAASAWKIVAEELGLTAEKIDEVKRAAGEANPALERMQALSQGFVKGFQDALGDYVQKALDEAAEEAKALAERFQGIVDKAHPASAAARQLADDVKFLRESAEFAKLSLEEQNSILGALTGEWKSYGITLASEVIPQLDAVIDRSKLIGTMKAPNVKATGTVTATETDVSRIYAEMDRAGKDFTNNLADGMSQAVTTFAREFIETGEFNVKSLGDMLLDVLLDAAQQYFSTMLANQAKLQMAGGSSGTGTGGMGSGMSALGNVAMAAAVVYAVYAITDGIKKANDAAKYKETAVAGVYRGGIGSTYAGELSEQGRQMATALRGFLNEMQTVAGEWITSLPEIAVRVSGDGKKFQALVGGEIIGTFQSMSEAMVRSFQAAFSQANFGGKVDQVILDMVQNFRGNDVAELQSGIRQVRDVLNDIADLSDIEISLKELPFRAEALKQSIVQLGGAFLDASRIAAQWQADQMQSLRDQITGRQATAAEQRAQKEREALLFNAQLELNKLEIKMKRDKVAADIEILKAGGSLATADLNISTQYLGQVGRLTEVKADLLNHDLQIQQGHVNLMTAAGQAALEALNLQLAALDQVYATLDAIKPIDLREIRLPNLGGGGGNVSTGPSEQEQRALDFQRFLDDQFRASLTGIAGQIYDLNEAFDAQARAAAEVEGGEQRLAAARAAAMARLQEDTINGLGSPMESLRDRFDALREALAFLFSQMDKGSAATAHFQQVLAELQQQASLELLGLAAEIADAFGMDKEAALFRQKIAEIDLQLKIIQLRLLYQEYQALGLISGALESMFKDFFTFINDPANWPNFDNQGGGGGNNYDNGQSAIEAARARREQALISALDRLRAIQERYIDFRENLATSELSGATLRQRSDAALAQYQETLALAQAGNLDAMENLPNLATQFLQIFGQFVDPSSAQYQAMREQILAQMAGIEGGIAGVLAGVQNPAQQQVQELQNIAQILTEMRDLWGIIRPWNAGDGTGTILPGPGSGNGTLNWDVNPNAGLVYYGPQFGWHPAGWSPSGYTPPNWTPGLGNGATTPNAPSGKTLTVSDHATQAALARMESKLEAAMRGVARATDKQTEHMKSAGTIEASARSRQKWAPENDRMAS